MSRMARRALLSVTDKTGLVELATALRAAGWELLATGGTAALLKEKVGAVLDVGEVTGAGEILGGRVKTLAPVIFGGILARRDHPADLVDLAKIGAAPIDLVVCNLYRFDESQPDIEKIDIGGVALIRAAAKNCAHVIVASDPSDYAELIAALHDGVLDGGLDHPERGVILRRRLAARAWRRVADYDASIAAAYALDGETDKKPADEKRHASWKLHKRLRYGENPHQSAAWWVDAKAHGLQDARIVEGKELSYNNIIDLIAAAALVRDLGPGSAAVIKHQNPCGVASLGNVVASVRAAVDADPISAFGGILAVHGVFDVDAVDQLGKLFLEVIVADVITPEARDLLAKRKNLRVIEWPNPELNHEEWRAIPGGVLTQSRDDRPNAAFPIELNVVSRRAPSAEEQADMRIADVIVKHVRSNAIVLVKDRVTVGVGAGQMNRADSVRIAVGHAGEKAHGAVMASDAFFPFADGIESAPGVTAVIQPGGSIRDQEVIAAADRRGIAMVFTGVRHFKH